MLPSRGSCLPKSGLPLRPAACSRLRGRPMKDQILRQPQRLLPAGMESIHINIRHILIPELLRLSTKPFWANRYNTISGTITISVPVATMALVYPTEAPVASCSVNTI